MRFRPGFLGSLLMVLAALQMLPSAIIGVLSLVLVIAIAAGRL